MFPNFYRSVADFFANTVKQVINLRQSTRTRRDDIMQSSMDLMDTENGMPLKEVISQSFKIFMTGYEMADQPEVRDRAKKEVQHCSLKT